jgi:hypothetical protein
MDSNLFEVYRKTSSKELLDSIEYRNIKSIIRDIVHFTQYNNEDLIVTKRAKFCLTNIKSFLVGLGFPKED